MELSTSLAGIDQVDFVDNLHLSGLCGTSGIIIGIFFVQKVSKKH